MRFHSHFVSATIVSRGANSISYGVALSVTLADSGPPERRIRTAELALAEILEVEKFLSRVGKGTNDLVQLRVDHLDIPILAPLNHEHHQERHRARHCVHDEFPCVRPVRDRPSESPKYTRTVAARNGMIVAGFSGDRGGEAGKGVRGWRRFLVAHCGSSFFHASW